MFMAASDRVELSPSPQQPGEVFRPVRAHLVALSQFAAARSADDFHRQLSSLGAWVAGADAAAVTCVRCVAPPLGVVPCRTSRPSRLSWSRSMTLVDVAFTV